MLDTLEHYILGAFPEDELSQLSQVFASFGYSQEVVAGQLADDAREARAAVGEEDLRLAVTTGVEEYLAGRRKAGVVLETQPQVEIAQRDPGRLPASASLDDLVLEGQKPTERLAGLRRGLFLEARHELQRAGHNV